ncbi:MAG: hypothetical protein QXD23_02725 [Candidatus Micrarchaeaceae archaeon]
MISGIVTSLDENHLLVIPSSEVSLNDLIGRKARYVDKSGKIWKAEVYGVEDPGILVKFDIFPSGLGQGQIIDIIDEQDNETDFLSGSI